MLKRKWHHLFPLFDVKKKKSNFKRCRAGISKYWPVDQLQMAHKTDSLGLCYSGHLGSSNPNSVTQREIAILCDPGIVEAAFKFGGHR